MSLARLSAGSGYRYLLKHTACGDCARDAGTSLTSYYAESGYPAGRWFGSGLAGLNGGRGLTAGTAVTEEAMAALYGRGHDPVSGAALGRAYPTYRTADDRIADAVNRLPETLTGAERQAATDAIETRERARPVKAAVAGFDLTFTAPKSASVLWALGDPGTQQAIADAHRDAVTSVLSLIEDRFLHTRTGAHSCAQVATRGMLAAGFEHWDTRTGDPNLHTHVVIANKVQGPDGRWRSVDGQAIYHAAVACSEVYDTLLADALAARLPLTWGLRDRGDRRNPAFEIDGVDDVLLTLFSARSSQIEAHLRGLLADFSAEYGRDPTRREMLRLRQQSTLASRPEKTVAPLPDLFTRWRTQAAAATGRPIEEITASALHAAASPVQADAVPAELIERFAQATLVALGERRSTWTRPNLLAEAARATRLLRVAEPSERIALLDRVVDAALSACVALDPPEVFNTPARFRRANGTSAFTRPDEHAFTTAAVLAAEARLLAGTTLLDAARVDAEDLAAAAARIPPGAPGRRLSADQQAAVVAIASSGRRIDVLVGPAGTGKTRTLRALRAGWEHVHGRGSVIGLAPSSTAAAELSAALGVTCENTAKWLHESTRDDPDPRWVLRRGQLLVLDEASMVATGDLDALATQAATAGAKLVLVGDHHQLGAVGAGGAFALLAEQQQAVHLSALWRFEHQWEAEATRGLRDGRTGVLDAYAEHDRLRGGPGELMMDAAYTAWAADIAAGRTAVLVATDRRTVAALNRRAHDDRVDAGLVHPDGIALADETSGGVGDIVVTRRNDRRIPAPDGHVRNGALWQITAASPDGSIEVRPLPRTGDDAHNAESHADASANTIHLPAEYVQAHVELGYATTVHRAQGTTVDRGHAVIQEGMTRQQLYVAMTRGRGANHAYVALDGLDPTCPQQPDEHVIPTVRQMMDKVLATDGAELSATATLRRRQNDATSLRHLLPIRDTLTAAAEAGDGETGRSADEIRHLLRLRAEQARRAQDSRPACHPATPAHHTHEGIQR
ncbi:MAG: relaxase domain-containing protein [Sporichthya sp.]|nr:relaxase domain-containing protein [Sporichthya sp.]